MALWKPFRQVRGSTVIYAVGPIFSETQMQEYRRLLKIKFLFKDPSSYELIDKRSALNAYRTLYNDQQKNITKQEINQFRYHVVKPQNMKNNKE